MTPHVKHIHWLNAFCLFSAFPGQRPDHWRWARIQPASKLCSTLRSNLSIFISISPTIVNGGDWLWSPANIKGANKDAKIYVRRSTTLHNLLFCVHTLCMNYVTSTFLLVSSSVRSKQLLCFVQGQGQKREQKHTTKNFVGFHNHSLY